MAVRRRSDVPSALAMAALPVTNFLFVFNGMVVNLALPMMQRDRRVAMPG